MREQATDFQVQTERAVHHAFASERLRVFVGRDSNRAAIAAHISSGARHPLVITGRSGSGKTALMARAAADEAQRPNAKVVQRFIGASATSASQRHLLISVMDDLVALGVTAAPAQWEENDNRFINQILDLLTALDQPVTIFIDALDQWRAPYRPAWLPAHLNPNVKLVVSALDDEAFASERTFVEDLRRTLPENAFFDVEPLSAEDGADILAALQREAQRGLAPHQQALVVERFLAAGASPLYLNIAFAIAQRWRSTEEPARTRLADDVTALIGQFIDELSRVHHHEAALVRRALGLIAAAREGLSESEIIAVLSRDTDVMGAVSSERFGAHTQRLPDSVWVRLKRSLSPLLVEKGVEGATLINFFHRQVSEVVRAHFYEPEKASLHRALVAYFDPRRVVSDGECLWTRRALVELPFQLFSAGDREGVDALLTDAGWIDAKVQQFGGVREIVEDYDFFADRHLEQHASIGRALRLSSGILSRDPQQVMAQLYGRLPSGESTDDLRRSLLARIPEGALYVSSQSLTTSQNELERLEARVGIVWALTSVDECTIASASTFGPVVLWDVNGEGERARLLGHSEAVTSLVRLSPGAIASASRDRTIRVWDIATRREIACLDGHDYAVNALVVLPNGNLVSGSDDMTVRIWDCGTFEEVLRFDDLMGPVTALTVLRDGRLAIATTDTTVSLWDYITNAKTGLLEGHRAPASAMLQTTDGILLTAGRDHDIRAWDVDTCQTIRTYKGHTEWVSALALSQDGRLVSASEDKTIRVWDLASDEPSVQLHGHDEWVCALLALPDGRVASGSVDGVVRLWRLDAGSVQVDPPYFKKEICAFTGLAGGRVAVIGEDGGVDVWSQRGKESVFDAIAPPVEAAVGLSDGRLAVAVGAGTILLIDLERQSIAASLDGYRTPVRSLAVLPEERLASGHEDGSISVWGLREGRELFKLQGGRGAVLSLSVSPAGELVSTSHNKWIFVWDLEARGKKAEYQWEGASNDKLVVLDNGLVAKEDHRGIALWPASSSSRERRLHGFPEFVLGLLPLPDGRLLITFRDKLVRLLDVETSKQQSALELDSKVAHLTKTLNGDIVVIDVLGRIHWLQVRSTDAQPSALRQDTRSRASPIERRAARKMMWTLVAIALALAASAAALFVMGVL